MRGKASLFGLLGLTAALFVLVLGASPAKAAFGIEKFEAVTCDTDLTLPGVGDWENTAGSDPCLAGDPVERFYTQAAGHPNFGITAFLMNQTGGAPNLPDGFIKEIRTELPEGLGVNPEATPQCTRKQLGELAAVPPPIVTKCATEVPGSQVGVNYFTTISTGPPNFPVPAGTEFTAPVPVYNLEPEPGEPSSAGFNATGKPTILESDLDPKDQHISFTIHDIEAPPASLPVIGSRLVFEGQKGEGYLTMPSNCAGPQVTQFRVKSHPYPTPPGPELEDSESFETAVGAEGCENVPFDPGIGVTASGATDSPEPATVDVTLPYNPEPDEIQTSHLLTAKVTLPQGAGLNPSVANGLEPCTNAQFAKGTNDPVACPPSSKVGTVEVETPALPEIIGGDVYVAAPNSNDPSTGEQFRIFIHVSSAKFGVNVRLIGNVFPNLETGQLTAVVGNNPQAPFNSFKVHLDGGPRGALTSPDTCGPHKTTAEFTPWSRPGENVPDSAEFTLTSAPGGGPCPATLAERPFSPGFKAGTQNAKAGSYSPFELNIVRPDGAQELRRVDVQLPPGMVAKLAGVEYCPEASIAAAGQHSGAAELASASCPANSLVGTFKTRTGSGAAPLEIDGKVYFAGPYKGAPVSLVFVTPAVAGPYDLGTVVIRTALNLNPETAVVKAVSDPIPYVFGGVKLDIRSIDVSVNRNSYTLNPTNCSSFSVSSEIFGGGGNPADPASWSTSKPATPFQATDCGALKFKPKFTARILGGKGATKRTANPKFQAILEANNGDANLSRAAFILPQATILDQSHIKTICTRVQLAANACPSKSIYGNAKARSPLLDGPLKGPVYLTSSSNELPDLLVNLRGQVNIWLRGAISSKGGRLKTVFRTVPDVPVKKFTLNMKGGKQGLLTNTVNLCGKKRFGVLNLKAQNGKQRKTKKQRLNVKGCKRK